jgi:hypothetical protein
LILIFFIFISYYSGYKDSSSCSAGTSVADRVQASPSNICDIDTTTGVYESFTCTSGYVDQLRWSDAACTVPLPSGRVLPHTNRMPTGKYCGGIVTILGFLNYKNYYYGTVSCENII